MTLKAINAASEYFQKGEKVVKVPYGVTAGDAYGVEVLKPLWVEEVNDYVYLVVEGDVKNGKWVGLKHEGTPAIKALTIKQLRNSYTHKWTPGTDVKPGDILVDQDNVLFLVASLDVVWNLSRGTKTTLARWEAAEGGNRKFTQKKSASGKSFNEIIGVTDKWFSQY